MFPKSDPLKNKIQTDKKPKPELLRSHPSIKSSHWRRNMYSHHILPGSLQKITTNKYNLISLDQPRALDGNYHIES